MLNASNSHRPEYLDIVHETIVHDSSSFLLTNASCMTVFWPETLSGSPMGLSSLRAASGSSSSISSHSLRIAYLCVCQAERGVMGWSGVSDDSWLWKRSEKCELCGARTKARPNTARTPAASIASRGSSASSTVWPPQHHAKHTAR